MTRSAPTGIPRRALLVSLLALLVLAACSTTPEGDPTEGRNAAEIYKDATSEMLNGQYETAINLYSKLIARYPYGVYAEHAMLGLAYSQYRDFSPESAILTAERFIKLYPRHQYVDYAYYLRGVAAYAMEQGFIFRLFRQDPTERDAQAARRALGFFNELIRKFPASRYVPDSRKRVIYLRNHMARYEIHVASYYIRKEAWLAAANRAQYVLENYQQTPSVPEALAILVRAYEALKLDGLASDALAVLAHNYPEHQLVRARKRASGS